MERKSGRFWSVKPFGIFIFALVVWFILAIWTGTSYAVELYFNQDLRSHLLANYGDGLSNQSLKYLSLTILGEVLTDQGMMDGSIGLFDQLLQDPVPTATRSGGPEEIVQPPAISPSPTPNFNSTAMALETESGISDLSITEVFTPIPTGTSTETPTTTFTLTVTKIDLPTETSTPTKIPTQTPVIDDVYPILEFVENNGGSRWIAYFDYKNPSTETQYIPFRERDYFSQDPKDQGQPTSFSPGRYNPYPEAAFTVEFEESDALTWHLTAFSVGASKYSDYFDRIFMPTPIKTLVPQDTEQPILRSGQLNPEPGFINDCSVDKSVDDLLVQDPSYSSGILRVKLQYVVENTSPEIYSDPLNLVDGGTTSEGGWDGQYGGSVTVNINPEWQSPEPEPFTVNVWIKAKDYVSREGLSFLGTSTLPDW
ncbi:MAG: hypothetical protein A2Z14_05115 [Chloroflexi bacterium RBG_16_48_8]|nr:MAG: hypothetical protein A2Z14_05115 [Chloroflexi bacterium RBG_16_48_8]